MAQSLMRSFSRTSVTQLRIDHERRTTRPCPLRASTGMMPSYAAIGHERDEHRAFEIRVAVEDGDRRGGVEFTFAEQCGFQLAARQVGQLDPANLVETGRGPESSWPGVPSRGGRCADEDDAVTGEDRQAAERPFQQAGAVQAQQQLGSVAEDGLKAGCRRQQHRLRSLRPSITSRGSYWRAGGGSICCLSSGRAPPRPFRRQGVSHERPGQSPAATSN